MNILTLDHLTKAYTHRNLLEDASFYLQEGERVGLIGINGTGKSTLLKILAGLEEPDSGKRILAANLTTAFLPQHPVFPEEATVIEVVAAGKNESDTAAAKAMLTRLGVSDFAQPVKELSGGQKKRLALVQILVNSADILFLDEPTNHLDAEMSDWLENYLKGFRGALVMITHDRYFLDSVTNRIVELDHGSLYSYDGGYSSYLELKAQREDYAQAAERKRQSILRTELAWVQRGARARSTKQKARLERYEMLKTLEAPQADQAVELNSISTRMGKTTVECHDISKGYGDRMLVRNFSYIFLKNDRISIVGPNGCGKSTLMKILAGKERPDTGELVVGQTIKIGYYSQMIEDKAEEQEKEEARWNNLEYMDPQEKVIDYIKNTAEYVQTKDGSVSASKMLERFLFTPDAQYSPIGKLSGGEKRRLNLLRILMEAPNVLLLDEPTNDLDITTLTILEDYLDQFDGIVIVVSHDRYFLDRTVRRLFAFEADGSLRQYEGGYTYYETKKGLDQEEETEKRNSRSGSGQSNSEKIDEQTEKSRGFRGENKRKLKMSYQEARDYENIEADIAALEEKISDLDQKIVQYATDFVKLNEVSKQKEETEQLLEAKMERWEYLEELAERIANGEMA
ncbi:MAG: ABC-F family ATP-binding cassette domain-containing protein [Lachnospiraceae bacterium]|nr:ABC-F family ATP-binding cassette domain-containing protein [Lachnospiraceae bacterium]